MLVSPALYEWGPLAVERLSCRFLLSGLSPRGGSILSP